MKLGFPFVPLPLLLAVSLAGCGSSSASPDGGPRDAGGPVDGEAPPRDATVDTSPPVDATPPPPDAMPQAGTFCALPGSVLWTGGSGPYVMPGGPPGTPDLTWLEVPAGFCVHYFGNVADARQLRLAPGGELFVASPTTTTTGGNTANAVAGIVVLPDDNHDGIADQNITFLTGLPSVQALLFANGAFYYQDGATIRSIPYHKGDRSPSGPSQTMTTITAPQDGLHWTKVMDVAMDGTIYVTNGGSQGEVDVNVCETLGPGPHGAIFAVLDGGATSLVAKGFRNPIALRCETNHNACLATELALDYSAQHGGREKVVPVRQGDDWGYSCCASKDLAYAGMTLPDGGTPDCSGVTPETDSFVIGDTPFGVDFDNGTWPAPWGGRAYVTLHGRFGDWVGARVVTIALDPATGFPLPGTDFDPDAGANTMLDFATGWDDGAKDHGRPAPIAFAADGRMFVGNDNDGTIVWIAPQGLQARWP